MITGVVKFNEAQIRIKIMGPMGRQKQISAVVDTGYTASLTLSPATIAVLGLRRQGSDRAILADGSECTFDVYEAEVMWDGKLRRILVDEADADPLVGMELLTGYELKVQARSRGEVTIKRLPRK